MAFSGDNDVVDSVLYDVSGSHLAVTSSQVVSSTQPFLLVGGVSGSTVKRLSLDSAGALVVTGSVLTFATGTQVVSGTVNLDRGNSAASPMFISGTVGVGGPVSVTGSMTVMMLSGAYGGKVEGLFPTGGSDDANPLMIGGTDGTMVRNLLVDELGRLITAPAGSSSTVTSSLETGYVTTAAQTRVPVLASAYLEQTVNAQRSIVSTSANDAAAGTGARTVTIKYFDASLNGPYFETVTLNGTTPVNTVATNVCYIDDLRVMTVGSGGVNAGILNFKAAVAGGGVTITSIAAGDNRVFYAHHYVPANKTTFITGISVSHNGTTVGSGAVFIIVAKNILTANAAETQISDFIRLYGQSSTVTRTWGTAIEVTGPSKVTVQVTPETSTSTVYRAALDLYDQ